MQKDHKILDYLVERLLGEGGMGAVYLARHTVLDQQVAIKILDPEVARKPGIKERFIQEANIQAKLIHPNIVRVLTATNNDGGIPALIMDYVEGKSLSEVLELRGALPVKDALKIMEQVLSAVGYAHRQGVIHRDLKPSNVMVMASGEAKVTDFGIAKVLGSTKLTRTGTAMGSAHYMSPEQIRRPETVDARSDIYSLGCVFYEVLTGRPPFGEKDASGTESDYEVKTAHVTEAAPALEIVKSGIPAWLAKLVMSMLEKEPDQRSSSCEAILDKLKAGDGLGTVREDNATGTSGRGQIEPEQDQKNSLKKTAAVSSEKQVTRELGALIIVIFIVLGASIVFLNWDKKSSGWQDSGQIENSVAPTEQAPNTIADQAAQLVRKIEAGNPNNLAPCPKDRNALHHNCWGTFTGASVRYVGEWRDNEPNGLGMETHSTGDKYVGEYKGIKRNGQGTFTFANGDKYVGEFKDDKRNGQGTFTFADGDKYVGESKDDKRNGQGTYTFANGNKYVGEFKNDKWNGQGTYTFANGYKYVGEFKNNLYHGRGIIYRANGSVEESGIYQNDKLIKAEYVDPNSFSRIVKGAHHVDTKQDDDPNQGKKNDSRHELDAEPSARKVVTPDADNHRWKFNYYALEKPLLSNVAGSRKVMQVTLTIMTHYDDRVIKNVKVHELALRAGILDVMRQKTEADLRKPDFRKALAEEVRLIINSLLEKYEGFGGIEEVTFTEFVVQQPS